MSHYGAAGRRQLGSVGGGPFDIRAPSSSASKSGGSLNWSCLASRTSAPQVPLYGLPAVYLGLLLTAPVALIICWLWRNLLLPPLELEQFPHSDGADQVPAIWEEQPRLISSILSADQVGVAATAIRGSIRPILGRRPPQADSDGYFRYPAIHYLEAGDVRFIDPNSMEMIRGLPDAAAVEILRQASIQLSDVVGNPSILHADSCALATESTETIIKLKTTTALICLIWRELNGQNCQLCQQVKEEWFALVACQSVEKLLEVARSFSDARWSACHFLQVLTIFDALVDVLYNIQGLPLNRDDEVAGISIKVVNAIRGILEGTTNDIDSSEESAIYPANDVLMQVLGFFHDVRDKVQSILGTGDPCSYMFDCWVSKLEEDAERIFQDEKDRRCIFLLNNAYYVEQMMCRPGGLLFSNEARNLDSLIEQYKKSYFDECWVPLMIRLLKNPRRSSLDTFTEGFVSIYNRQKIWKVTAELRYKLRQEIENVIVPAYRIFLRGLPANQSRVSEVLYSLRGFLPVKKKQTEYTGDQLEEKIEQLFESSNAS